MINMTYIDNFKDLENLCSKMIETSIDKIGLDFEGEFNLHRYGIHLCLVQIVFNDQVYIIDPVVIEDLSPLKIILESTKIEKIIYACNIDVRLLKKTHDIHIKNIFDIRCAAISMRLEQTGLPALISSYLNIEMEKDKKCQKSNWNKRPLSVEQLEYACNDVIYLIPLREVMNEEMNKSKVFKQFKSTCKRLEKEVFVEKANKHTRVANYNSLSKNERIFLKNYYYARENAAERLNYPPFWVMSKETLVEIAKSPPKDKNEWEKYLNLAEKNNLVIEIFLKATESSLAEIK